MNFVDDKFMIIKCKKSWVQIIEKSLNFQYWFFSMTISILVKIN